MFTWNIALKSTPILSSQNLSYYIKILLVVVIGQYCAVSEYGGKVLYCCTDTISVFLKVI